MKQFVGKPIKIAFFRHFTLQLLGFNTMVWRRKFEDEMLKLPEEFKFMDIKIDVENENLHFQA